MYDVQRQDELEFCSRLYIFAFHDVHIAHFTGQASDRQKLTYRENPTQQILIAITIAHIAKLCGQCVHSVEFDVHGLCPTPPEALRHCQFVARLGDGKG
jgi:hypothetical protein